MSIFNDLSSSELTYDYVLKIFRFSRKSLSKKSLDHIKMHIDNHQSSIFFSALYNEVREIEKLENKLGSFQVAKKQEA